MQQVSPDLRLAEAVLPVSEPLHVPASTGAGARPRAEPGRRSPLSIYRILILLALGWGLAVCGHAPEKIATTGLAAIYGLLFLLLLPFDRWACFLVLVAGCAAESALRAWSPFRYNTLHYQAMLLLPVAFILTRPRAHLPRPLLYWLALAVWSAVSLLWSQSFDHWVMSVTEYFGLANLTLLTRQLATSPQRRREMGMVYAVTSLATLGALIAVSGVATGGRLGEEAGFNANGLGRLAALGILMLAMSAIESERKKLLTPTNVALVMAMGVAMMLSQSRGAMMALAGAAVTIALGQRQLRHRVMGLGACLVIGLALVLAAMQIDPEGMQNRWKSTVGNKNMAGATSGRSELWRTTGYVLQHNWLAGVGAGQFRFAFKEYSTQSKSVFHRGKAMQAHNVYVNIQTEGGVVASLLMLCFFGSLWAGTSRLPRGQRRAIARALIVYVLISGFSGDGLEKGSWLATGLLFVWFWDNQRRCQSPRPAPAVRALVKTDR